jgi:hypothetical protein
VLVQPQLYSKAEGGQLNTSTSVKAIPSINECLQHFFPTLPPFPAAALVYLAERINKLLASRWRLFSQQQYFDEQGVFTSALLSAPLLLNMFIILVRAGYSDPS